MRVETISEFLNEERLDGLAQAACDLSKRTEGHDVVAVGQSVSWLVYMLGLLHMAQGNPCATSFLAFSGNFLRYKSTADVRNIYGLPQTYPDGTNPYPPAENVQRYKEYLEAEGKTPQQLIDKFNRTGRRTAFVDYAGSGQGYASFIHTLLSTSTGRDAFELTDVLRAVTFVCCTERYGLEKFVIPVSQGGNHVEIPLLRLQHPPCIWGLMGGNGDKDVKPDSLRLVPHFDISAKGNGCMKHAGNAPIVAEMKDIMTRYVQTHPNII